MALGASIELGLVANTLAATIGLAAICVSVCVVWILLAVGTVRRAPSRTLVAATLERSESRFQDRLNTLLHLQAKERGTYSDVFAARIDRQAKSLLLQKSPHLPFPMLGTALWLVCFIFVLSLASWTCLHYAPWKRLGSVALVKSLSSSNRPQLSEIAFPAAAGETFRNWGEVRITRPGSDLRVTKVDVVPLTIEVAASQDITNVEWISSVNGAEEQNHTLERPREPRAAVYEPIIYLDELDLSDWDVLTYYARAKTASNCFNSDVYFLEVRPFREDIAKMPGGEAGEPNQALSNLSSLVGRQQQVIRETYQYVQKSASNEALEMQAPERLARCEEELAQAALHCYADLTDRMANKPIGPALDNLAQARTFLEQAGHALRDSLFDIAQPTERSALAHLVAARKIFQKAVTDHPGDFNQPLGSDSQGLAKASNKLNEMAEFRDEAKSAQEFVERSMVQQQEVQQQANSELGRGTALAAQEERLQRQLKDFAEQHPRGFNGAKSETTQVTTSLGTAAEKLRDSLIAGAAAAAAAMRNFEKLRAAMQSHGLGQQVADAYQLKRMIDEKARELGQLAQPENTASVEEFDRVAGTAQAVVDQLRRLLEKPAGANFGQPLRDALNKNNNPAEEALSRVLQSQNDKDRHDAAQKAQQTLNELSQAFAASQPTVLQADHHPNAPQPGDSKQTFDAGLDQLGSLAKQLERNAEISPVNQAKQARQALENLRQGMQNLSNPGEQGDRLLGQLKEMIASGHGFDAADLQRLKQQLERFSVEAALKPTGRGNSAEVAHADPARFPPAYRHRIEKYFQKLSEE